METSVVRLESNDVPGVSYIAGQDSPIVKLDVMGTMRKTAIEVDDKRSHDDDSDMSSGNNVPPCDDVKGTAPECTNAEASAQDPDSESERKLVHENTEETRNDANVQSTGPVATQQTNVCDTEPCRDGINDTKKLSGSTHDESRAPQPDNVDGSGPAPCRKFDAKTPDDDIQDEAIDVNPLVSHVVIAGHRNIGESMTNL